MHTNTLFPGESVGDLDVLDGAPASPLFALVEIRAQTPFHQECRYDSPLAAACVVLTQSLGDFCSL